MLIRLGFDRSHWGNWVGDVCLLPGSQEVEADLETRFILTNVMNLRLAWTKEMLWEEREGWSEGGRGREGEKDAMRRGCAFSGEGGTKAVTSRRAGRTLHACLKGGGRAIS